MPDCCPLCGSDDWVEFAFIAHFDGNNLNTKNNPSDMDRIRICPNLHVRNLNNEIVERKHIDLD